jgi:uncharacterized protein (DUF433 family)
MNAAIESPAVEIGALIVSTPDVLGGRPRIRGHRVPVHRIAGWWRLGLSVEEIAAKHPTLGPAEIHAALAYYHLHRAEIDGYLAEESKLAGSPLPSAAA